MFESAASWSLPEHQYLVSGWSARCPHGDTEAMDCTNTLEPPLPGTDWNGPNVPGKVTNSWTDITYLLDKAQVSWRYYVYEGLEPDCESDEAITCKPVKQGPKTPGIWNPLADFTDVNQDGQLGNIQSLDKLLQLRARNGELRAAKRLLDRPQHQGLRAPAFARLQRPGLRHDARQLDHAQPLLGQHRDPALLG